MFIPHPPWASFLDRLLRTLGYLALSVFAFYEAGLIPHGPSLHTWYNIVIHLLFALTSAGCAGACIVGLSQAEMVILPLVLGASSASWILVVSVHGVGPRATALLAVVMFLSARMNWLRWLRHRALVFKALTDRG